MGVDGMRMAYIEMNIYHVIEDALMAHAYKV